MAVTVRPLENMRKIIDGARADLKQLRSMNAKLQTNMAAVSSRQQFTSEYIRTESGKLRASARDVAREYLFHEQTLSLLESVAAQAERWSVREFLLHAANDAGTSDVATLLKKNNLLLSMSRMSTATLATVAQAAVDRADWATVGTIYTEADYRKHAGDDVASALVAGISSIQPPELAEAKNLIAEARQMAEWVGYAARSIETGQEDIGIKFESYAQQAAERDAARAA